MADPNQAAAAHHDTREGAQQHQMPLHAEKMPGRNDLCPCGSNKKFKNCHGKRTGLISSDERKDFQS